MRYAGHEYVDWQSPVNWQHPQNRGLSLWLLNAPYSSSGGTLRDLVRSAHGTLTALDTATCWTRPIRDGHWGSVTTDGVDGYVDIAGGGGLNNVQTGTISLWVRWNGTQDAGTNGNNGSILGRQQGVTFSNHIISLNGTNPDTAKIRWAPYISNTFACTSATSPGSGVWRHVCIAYSSGSHVLYLDGVQDATGVTTGTIANNAATSLTLGAWIGAGASFSLANLDCLRLFPGRFFGLKDAQDEYQTTKNWCDGLLRVRRRGIKAPSTNRRRRLLFSRGAA